MRLRQLDSGLIVPIDQPTPPTREKQIAERRDMLSRYHRAHACCPECGSTSHISTCIGFIGEPHIDRNKSKCCGCGWHGTVHDRVPSIHDQIDELIQQLNDACDEGPLCRQAADMIDWMRGHLVDHGVFPQRIDGADQSVGEGISITDDTSSGGSHRSPHTDSGGTEP